MKETHREKGGPVGALAWSIPGVGGKSQVGGKLVGSCRSVGSWKCRWVAWELARERDGGAGGPQAWSILGVTQGVQVGGGEGVGREEGLGGNKAGAFYRVHRKNRGYEVGSIVHRECMWVNPRRLEARVGCAGLGTVDQDTIEGSVWEVRVSGNMSVKVESGGGGLRGAGKQGRTWEGERVT